MCACIKQGLQIQMVRVDATNQLAANASGILLSAKQECFDSRQIR